MPGFRQLISERQELLLGQPRLVSEPLALGPRWRAPVLWRRAPVLWRALLEPA